MIVAIKDEVKDYRDNFNEAFEKSVFNLRDMITMVTIIS